MTDPQQREYLTEPGFAWKVVVAQLLRRLLTSPLIMLGLIAALLGYLSIWGSLGSGWSVWWIFAVLAGFYALLIGVALLVSWAMLRKNVPTGSRFTATLRPGTLAFTGPLGDADVDYATYRSVTRRSELVFLRMRAAKTQTVLPAQLFPGDEYDRLVASIANAPAPSAGRESDSDLAHEHTPDAGYAARLARSTTVYALTRPGLLVILILLALPGALGLPVVVISLLMGDDPGAGFGILGFSVVVIGLIIGLSYLMIYRALRRQSPAGSRYGLGFTETGLALRLPQYSAEIPFDRVRGITRRGEFTMILLRPGRLMVPSAILPLEAEAHLLSKVQQ